jgi:dihydroxyacetone kinase-like protein
MIQAVADTVIGHADELTELDRAIGDADHGVNLERGFKAVLAKIDTISAQPINDALSEVGKTLILSVGVRRVLCTESCSPPSGSIFAARKELSKERVVSACEQAIGVLKTLGRSDVGHKTMLDVLVPSLDQLRATEGPISLHEVRKQAHEAALATIPMVARRGRASFLGERSQGHMDPGARSSELIVGAVCDFLETRL